MRRRIAFLHLPKSAGSSVRTAVAAAAAEAGNDRVAPYQLDRTLFGRFDAFDDVDPAVRSVVLGATRAEGPTEMAMSDGSDGSDGSGGPGDDTDGLDGYDLVLGHFALSTLRSTFADHDVFALLREPRARLVSHFSFWFGWTADQHAAWAPYPGSRVPGRAGWEGFLRDPSVASQTDNLMIRLLLCPHPSIPAGDFIATDDIDDLAAQAATRLTALGHVDIIDRGPDFWGPLSAWLGTELAEVRDNVTPAPPDSIDWATALTPAAERALADRTRGDRALWDLVAHRTLDADDAAALADASYVRQVVRAASAATPVDVPPAAPPAPWRRIIDRVRGPRRPARGA